jgi:serralysin
MRRPFCPALFVALTLTACGSTGGGPSDPATPAPTGRFLYNGLDHVSWWHDEYLSAEASSSRRALATTSANWAGVLVTWYMPDKNSTIIEPDLLQTPTDEAVRRAIQELRSQGQKVMLKPHVDVKDGTWRGTITPADKNAWFQSYRTFILHYAALAQETGVELLCVGTELATLSDARSADEWSDVIAGVRGTFGGLLTYAANATSPADEFTSVSFWGRLDVLGLDAYVPLTDKINPTREELVRAWTRNRYGADMVAAFRNWQAAWGKPVIFTEIGYRSADGANRAPWDWQASASADVAEQADCYEAAYQVWTRENAWMNGIFWWAWSVPEPRPGDTDYNPRGKPAEEVLRRWQR